MARLNNYIFLLLLSFLFLSTEAFPDSKFSASNSSFEVIPEKKVIFNENEIYLIVKFNLEKDWHTYWINPGDSGDPAFFDWDLPEGFKISQPIWPTPELIPYPPLTTFGYSDELKLLFKLSLPNKIKETNKISVTSKWLVCADVCIPQEGKIKFTLDSGNESPLLDESLLIKEIKKKYT